MAASGVNPTIWFVVLVIEAVVSLPMIVLGSIHLDNCPAERYIPIYLIVSGCFYIVNIIVSVLYYWTWNEEGLVPNIIQGLIYLIHSFLLCWYIAGNVWIYCLYNKYDPDNVEASNYCDKGFYLFAFWVTTVHYILMGIGTVGFLCLVLCGGVCCCVNTVHPR